MATIAELRGLVGWLGPDDQTLTPSGVATLAEAVDELAALRQRVAELEAEVAALRATADTPPWRTGPRG